MIDEISDAVRKFYYSLHIMPTAVIVSPEIYASMLQEPRGFYALDLCARSAYGNRKYMGMEIFVSRDIDRFELVAQAPKKCGLSFDESAIKGADTKEKAKNE